MSGGRPRQGESCFTAGHLFRKSPAAPIFVVMVFAAASMGYFAAGWTLGDAAYMVTITIFSVGYDEVDPIDAT
jgi:hypothetical protein